MIESKNEQGVYKPDAINTTLKDSSETSANPDAFEDLWIVCQYSVQ